MPATKSEWPVVRLANWHIATAPTGLERTRTTKQSISSTSTHPWASPETRAKFWSARLVLDSPAR